MKLFERKKIYIIVFAMIAGVLIAGTRISMTKGGLVLQDYLILLAAFLSNAVIVFFIIRRGNKE
jgi:hypothetical protein